MAEAKVPLGRKIDLLAKTGRMEPANMIKDATFGMLLFADIISKVPVETAKIVPLCTGRNRTRRLHREIRRRRRKIIKIHLPLALLLDFQYLLTRKFYLLRGGDPCLTNAQGDPRGRSVWFPQSVHVIAKKHARRRTLQPNAGKLSPHFPDRDDLKNQKFILTRERAARRRAWILAKQLGRTLGKFEDLDDTFFKPKDPIKPSALHASDRSFVLDSGASYHLIGYNKLTEKRKSLNKANQRTFSHPERQRRHKWSRRKCISRYRL